ncbi:MAG: hypothetical protein U9M90_00895 [Patescibacteria group bacterium]|nr:hypothetical protein [Patescibacteria group bacterium]
MPKEKIVKKQPKRKIAELIENFPILGLIRYEWRWKKNNRWRMPKMNIHVQRADPESMHLQASNCPYYGRAYIGRENGDRGTRFEYMIAVNHDDMEVSRLLWEQDDPEKMSKDIFQVISPDEVSYLVWVSAIRWYEPSSEEREKETGGDLFGKENTGMELDVIVFRRPKKASFKELIETADHQKQEREEAYKYFPKKMPEFPGIHQGLSDGCKMHAFLSGGGLRVVCLDNDGKDVAYGEHPHIEEALDHLEEDFLAGGRPYEEVYGKLYPHYLTGSTLPTSNLDARIRRGETFDCWRERDEIIFELKGYAHTETPKNVLDQIERTGSAVQWRNRGYLYQTERTRFPSGDPAFSTKVISSPLNRDGANPWMYDVVKTGRGENFWEAVKKAFSAPEIEIHQAGNMTELLDVIAAGTDPYVLGPEAVRIEYQDYIIRGMHYFGNENPDTVCNLDYLVDMDQLRPLVEKLLRDKTSFITETGTHDMVCTLVWMIQ